jgi:hypothetical protein
MKERSPGIKLLAIFLLVSSLIGFFGSLAEIGLSGLGFFTRAPASGGGLTIFGVFALVTSFAGLVLTYGLWQLYRWAWYGTFALAIVNLVFESYRWLGLSSPNLFALLINLAILFYLARPEIKGGFA